QRADREPRRGPDRPSRAHAPATCAQQPFVQRRPDLAAMTYVPLEIPDLVLAALLLIANGAVSFWFRLGLERSLAISALRMVLQLSVVALALRFIFALNSPLWTIAFALFMAAAAAYEVVSRQER